MFQLSSSFEPCLTPYSALITVTNPSCLIKRHGLLFVLDMGRCAAYYQISAAPIKSLYPNQGEAFGEQDTPRLRRNRYIDPRERDCTLPP